MKANIKESKDNQAENASLISTGALCSKEIATEAAQSGNKPDTCSDAISSKGMTPENATEDKASPCPDAPGDKGSTSGDAENASHACHEASSGKEMAPQKAQSGVSLRHCQMSQATMQQQRSRHQANLMNALIHSADRR